MTNDDREAVVAEALRLNRLAEINSNAAERAKLEEQYGQVWNTDELSTDFTVVGFLAPYVVVNRKSDGAVGTLEFQHMPRFYFNFALDKR